jgi:RNA-directed DNA polymerase
MEKQIKAWLKASIMEGYANTPHFYYETKQTSFYYEQGTPHSIMRGIISPLLANIALHGLEEHLKTLVQNLPGKPDPSADYGRRAKAQALGVIRFADDFVLIHVNKHILLLCIEETKKWLALIGLEINTQSLYYEAHPLALVKDGRNGFTFLGFQVIQIKKNGQYRVKIRPSKDSIKKLSAKLREIMQHNKASSSYLLITKLRPILIGWANYFRFSECSNDFSRITHKIFLKIRAWALRRHSKKGRGWIKLKYFPQDKSYMYDGTLHRDQWTLLGTTKTKTGLKEAFLPHMSWIKSRKHVKVLGSKSPYDGDISI